MGSLCCIAAKKQDRSNSASQDLSFGTHEPYWRTNSSFSPPQRIHGLLDGINFYESSTSSNPNILHSLSSPDLSQTFHRTPNDCLSTRRDEILKQLPLNPTVESIGIRSSDIADLSSNRNFSNRRFFLSKPVYPLVWPSENFKESSNSSDSSSLSSDSLESVDVLEPAETQRVALTTFKCGLCNRYLLQKSPWGSRSVPITGVLPCQHVYHAECLEQATPMANRNNPPCPICNQHEAEHSPHHPYPICRLHNFVPGLKPYREDGSSTRPWGCTQASDCIENAVNVPPGNTLMLINRNRTGKNISFSGNSSQDFPGKLKKLNSRGKERASW